jgi:ABC-type antimicrobial peptide transport system permease subunit
MALGAQRVDVLGLVLRQSLMSTAMGMAVGLAGAAATTRYLEAMLFGVSPLDGVTFVAASIVLAAIAALAAFIPARRAASIDPSSALRQPL